VIERDAYEHILWFCKAGKKPFVNNKSQAIKSANIGFDGKAHGTNPRHPGIARDTNIIHYKVAGFDRRPGDHPCKFSAELCEKLLKMFMRPGMVVLDPCAGSGTVALVCQGYAIDWLAIEIDPEFVAEAEERLRTIPEFFRGAKHKAKPAPESPYPGEARWPQNKNQENWIV
jgi:DNA modification methylase